jgi:hypothetical protein
MRGFFPSRATRRGASAHNENRIDLKVTAAQPPVATGHGPRPPKRATLSHGPGGREGASDPDRCGVGNGDGGPQGGDGARAGDDPQGAAESIEAVFGPGPF